MARSRWSKLTVHDPWWASSNQMGREGVNKRKRVALGKHRAKKRKLKGRVRETR